MNVLVVDDDPISRRMIENTLREDNYQVTVATNGREALSLIVKEKHQLVVSDWRMPHLDGLALCRAIRTNDFRRYIYFIMVTSNVRPVDSDHGFAMGVDDYIIKPYKASELLMRVNVGRRIVQLETSQLTIFALAKLAESRDQDTGSHLERVRSYCRVLAEQLRSNPEFSTIINEEYVRLIYQTSPLHDIGKVAIPDSILLKPDKLTRDEFEVMKTHTLRGAETLDAALCEFPNAGFLSMARDIALTHHEKYDGSGYPNGLSGKQIPLCGRIVALSDVYDALTSKRVYKNAYSHEQALETILNDSGKHFDPFIVAAFIATNKQFDDIRRTYREKDLVSEVRATSDATNACHGIVPPLIPSGFITTQNSELKP
jgi:putative two-component system response regulator